MLREGDGSELIDEFVDADAPGLGQAAQTGMFSFRYSDRQCAHDISFRNPLGVTMRICGNRRLESRKSLTLFVTIAEAPPAIASSTRWLSVSSRKLGRQP